MLRNVSGILRTRYSNMFAFFGRISLELFVSHFHIWLAADSNGVLVLIPRYPVLNALVVTYIYICISHEVISFLFSCFYRSWSWKFWGHTVHQFSVVCLQLHCITRKLLPYAVPNNWKLALRNTFLFILLLMPVAIRDGMFWIVWEDSLFSEFYNINLVSSSS